MDFRQLEYIVAIAENKSISKAAETLFISQSGLTSSSSSWKRSLDCSFLTGTSIFCALQRPERSMSKMPSRF